MKKAGLLALFLLTGSAMFAETRVSIGIHLGGYGPPPVVAYVPPCPGPGYTWVPGYWYYTGPQRYWRAGYWAPPVYYSPRRIGPRGFAYGRRDRDFRDRDHGFRERDREFRERGRHGRD